MKNQVQVLALLLGFMSLITFGQKKELKEAGKAIKKNEFAVALTAINSLDAMLETMDSKYKAKYYFLKGQALSGENKYSDAADAYNNLFAYEKEIGKAKYTKLAQPLLNKLIEEVSNKAVKYYNEDKNYKLAAENFYLTYKLYPKDTSTLYNAAISASLAKDYDLSLKYYGTLKEVGYTGITMQYIATNKDTGKEENLGSKTQRDLMVKAGNYSIPLDKASASKQPEIIKSIGYLYVNQGKPELAIAALEEARKSNPKDINLLLNQAQMYVELERMDKFGELMVEAVKLDPNNPNLLYNLGVVNAGENKIEEAIDFYKKAIELDPKYGDAYFKLGITILNKRIQVIEEMNDNLSNDKVYAQLEAKLKKICLESLPYIIKADEILRTESTVSSLLNIYDTLEMETEADLLRAIYKEMRSQAK